MSPDHDASPLEIQYSRLNPHIGLIVRAPIRHPEMAVSNQSLASGAKSGSERGASSAKERAMARAATTRRMNVGVAIVNNVAIACKILARG